MMHRARRRPCLDPVHTAGMPAPESTNSQVGAHAPT
ncbi:hypothetical protein EV699_114132 [Plasticicumulans lactativorans]|uniref:Uncharacterized protein n=1 Tax=Plasticicumulans lactativorans TaxID=1133106 RepID=A0A4R2L8Q8_9GAMM|nr:hypothetical protein EV699_114132 [Plasticicumulans lactativorans]